MSTKEVKHSEVQYEEYDPKGSLVIVILIFILTILSFGLISYLFGDFTIPNAVSIFAGFLIGIIGGYLLAK